jgi:hypothetical protein
MHLSEANSKLKNLNNLAKTTMNKKMHANYVKFARIAASLTSGKVKEHYMRIINKHKARS